MKHVTEMIVQRIKPIKMEITEEVARDDPMNIITGSDNTRSKDHAKKKMKNALAREENAVTLFKSDLQSSFNGSCRIEAPTHK